MDVATREYHFESLAITPAAIDDLLVRQTMIDWPIAD